MGKISNIKTLNEEKASITLELTQKELLWLSGNLDKMYLFSEKNLIHSTRLVQRGKRDSTKYLLMPKEFRKHIIPTNDVACNIIETKTKSIMVFMVNKF